MLDRFEFQQHFAFDDEIGAEAFAQRDAMVFDRNRYLALNGQSALCQLIGEGQLVDRLNDLGVIRLMTLRGHGVGLLPTYVCREDVQARKLIWVLPPWQARADPVHLVYPRQRFVPAKLRAFIEIAASELGDWLRES